ncbi:MAG: AI-2E family transporter [Allosphingosinicella sp.]|uniref:AI-2E family transporter n=1 Tax=Allosphingosinicella sp. TaxID=2823234 RepID=UPI003956C767
MGHRQFIERLVIAIGVLGFAALLWHLRGLVILVFGAVLVAVILSIVAEPVRERLRLPSGLALLVAILIVLGGFLGAFWMFGAQVAAQASQLGEMVPAAWEAALAMFDRWGIGDMVRRGVDEIAVGSGMISNLGGIALSVGAGITDAVLIIVGGIYLAAQPALYREGLIKLFPPRARPLAGEAIGDSGRALRLWLIGQLVSMTLVGLLTGLGLWLLGVPSALALGIIAGILEFVPYVGPIAASFPAILVALAVSPELALWTALLYLLVQQAEGNLIQPLVQQRAVDLPPALLLFALVASGALFGIVGVLVAAPLTVVLYVLVKRLYVREALHTPTTLPGEETG